MRIKKKTPKPSAKRPPLYFIGYRGTTPQPDELKTWYDHEYGGSMTIRTEDGAPESWQVSHGPWSAHIVIPLPASHTGGLKEQIAWEHDLIGAVAPSVVPPRELPDVVLFAARLSRGLTLLTQGTAYDIITQQYLNPSDWKDRPLTGFVIEDHILMAQDDQARLDQVWCYTLGLSKFGIDELETFQPRGLPERSANELLAESAHEMIRIAHPPKVGTAFHLPILGSTIRIVNYRTASPIGRMLSFREIKS